MNTEIYNIRRVKRYEDIVQKKKGEEVDHPKINQQGQNEVE